MSEPLPLLAARPVMLMPWCSIMKVPESVLACEAKCHFRLYASLRLASLSDVVAGLRMLLPGAAGICRAA